LNGLFSTPKKFQDIQALKEELEQKSTLKTRRKIKKLANATIQEHTSAILLGEELKQARDEGVRIERNRRSERIQKEVDQRS
jgi:muramoyltetrapeptide carboxypeptidase LdcA involved in peptidoglycan recycling